MREPAISASGHLEMEQKMSRQFVEHLLRLLTDIIQIH